MVGAGRRGGPWVLRVWSGDTGLSGVFGASTRRTCVEFRSIRVHRGRGLGGWRHHLAGGRMAGRPVRSASPGADRGHSVRRGVCGAGAGQLLLVHRAGILGNGVGWPGTRHFPDADDGGEPVVRRTQGIGVSNHQHRRDGGGGGDPTGSEPDQRVDRMASGSVCSRRPGGCHHAAGSGGNTEQAGGLGTPTLRFGDRRPTDSGPAKRGDRRLGQRSGETTR